MYIRLVMIEFMQTLFPEPVAPATSRCGILSSSATTGFPDTSFPRAKASGDSLLTNSFEAIISLKWTVSRLLFGISTPTTSFPGTGASILTERALSASARSSSSDIILDTFIPSSGLNSNRVTTGPGMIRFTSPVTLKLASLSTSSFALPASSPSEMETLSSGGSSRVTGGGWNPPVPAI